MFKFLKNLFSMSSKVDLQPILEKGCVIIDVRTVAEYKNGHLKQSINIPLQDISTKIGAIKKHNKPVITCCASGMRSKRALSVLKANDIEAYNGGGWKSLKKQIL